MSYMTPSSQEKHLFLLCSYFHAHPTTLLLKILGGPMHGTSPHLKFGGRTVHPVPPRSPPLVLGRFLILEALYTLSHDVIKSKILSNKTSQSFLPPPTGNQIITNQTATI